MAKCRDLRHYCRSRCHLRRYLTITDQWQHNTTLGTIAEALATRGDIDRALSIANTITDQRQCDTTLTTIAEALAICGDIDRALTITDQWQHNTTLGTIAEALAICGDIDRALTLVQSIANPIPRVDMLKKIVQRVQSVTEKLVILQNTWFRSTIADDLWDVTSLITPLLKDYPWLGTAILDEEAWVNAQLKRLG